MLDTAARFWSKGVSRDRSRSASRLWPLVFATCALGAAATYQILAKVGHPAVPLDDAFIHFQYARRLATGHFFSYSDGDAYSSGATSMLWPALLAFPWALGLRGLSLIWAAWALGWAALGALAYETFRLAQGLTTRAAALGAGAMVLCFGGYVWFASSGMETTLLAWVLARTARRASEWGESPRSARDRPRRRELVALAIFAPFVRPEGALASLAATIALAVFPPAAVSVPAAASPVHPTDEACQPEDRPNAGRAARGGALRRLASPRFWAAAAAASLLLPSLLNWSLTGHAASATALVKWLPLNPYYGRPASLFATVRDNLDIFVRVLLDGKQWSAVFVPSGARPFALLALAAIPLSAARTRRFWRGGLVIAVALGMLAPCTYLSFLWNRLRYLWPFAFGWFVGLSCLSGLVREGVLRLGGRARGIDGLVAGAFAGAFAAHLPWALDDLATSASAIDRQQVTLGEWAARTLPKDARIGVNDTGAIAYLGGHRTFDVVGLTTPSEARYWVAGPGSRFEHYERLAKRTPSPLPTHFIVYPHWMACDAVLGRELERATVTDQTILGGTTMIAYEARWNLLGSGAWPLEPAPPADHLVDELDVADLESELGHAYDLGPNADADDIALSLRRGGRVAAVDGARVRRSQDRFTLAGAGGAPLVLIARLTSDDGAVIDVRIGGRAAGTLRLEPTEWEEQSLLIPAELDREGELAIELVARGDEKFGSAHYWLYRGR